MGMLVEVIEVKDTKSLEGMLDALENNANTGLADFYLFFSKDYRTNRISVRVHDKSSEKRKGPNVYYEIANFGNMTTNFHISNLTIGDFDMRERAYGPHDQRKVGKQAFDKIVKASRGDSRLAKIIKKTCKMMLKNRIETITIEFDLDGESNEL